MKEKDDFYEWAVRELIECGILVDDKLLSDNGSLSSALEEAELEIKLSWRIKLSNGRRPRVVRYYPYNRKSHEKHPSSGIELLGTYDNSETA